MMDEDNDGESSSAPSFESPEPSDEEDDDFKMVDADADVDDDDDVVGTTFQVPTLDSQEDLSIANWGSPSLATQPPPSSAPSCERGAQQVVGLPPNKKRKVSMSPHDSLARNPPLRRSPRATDRSRSAGAAGDAIVIDDDAVDDEVVISTMTDTSNKKRSTSSARKSQSGPSSQVGSMVSMLEEVPLPNETNSNDGRGERDMLKTALFPEESSSEPKNSSSSGPPQKKEKSKTAPKKDSSKTLATVSATATKKTKGKENSHQAPSKAKNKATAANAREQQQPSTDIAKKTTSNSKSSKEPSTSASTITTTKPVKSKKDSAVTTTQMLDQTTTETKKQKKKKRSFQDQLLQLLFMTCKPYTVKMLAQELKTTEASVNFCLLALVDKGWVMRKEFASKSGNRSKELYWGNQESKNKELMDSLDLVPPHEIEQAKEELKTLQQQFVSSTKELTEVLKEPSTAELNAQLDKSEQEAEQLKQRLHETHTRIRAAQGGGKTPSGSVNQFGRSAPFGNKQKQAAAKPVSTKRMKKRINDMRLQWKKRKEKCMDFVEQLADGMEKKVKDVVKLLELETDEMVGVTMPPKHEEV